MLVYGIAQWQSAALITLRGRFDSCSCVYAGCGIAQRKESQVNKQDAWRKGINQQLHEHFTKQRKERARRERRRRLKLINERLGEDHAYRTRLEDVGISADFDGDYVSFGVQ